MTAGNRRIWIMLIAEVVGLLCFGTLIRAPGLRGDWASAQLFILPFEAILLCLAGLLGTWAAYGEGAGKWRLIGWVAGLACLDGLHSASGLGAIPVPWVSVVSVPVTGLLLASRPTGVRLRRFRAPPGPPVGGGARFSIWALMVVVLAVAVLIVATEGLSQSAVAVILAYLCCFATAAVLAPRAALGLTRPAARCLVALAIPSALGGLFIARIYFATFPQFIYYAIYFTIVAEASLLLGSLLVLRSSGYRLAGRVASSADASPFGEAPEVDVSRFLGEMADEGEARPLDDFLRDL